MNILSGPINRLPKPSHRQTGRCASGAAVGWRLARSLICHALEHRAVFPPYVRAQATAIACSLPQTQGVARSRWSGATIAQRLQQTQVVPSIAPSTIRRWLAAECLRPWRYHLWQHIHDPVQFLERARPVLESYAQAQALLAVGTWLVCLDEKTSIQARSAERPPEPAIPGHPQRQSPRYKRGGALHLFAGLSVADGQVYGQCASRKRFVDFQAFLREVILPEARARRVHTLRLILDNGSTHAPKQFASWLAAEAANAEQPVAIEVCWLPPNASWLDQLELWFSILQRKLLQPNHFPHLDGLKHLLGAFITAYNRTAKPIKWSYTVERLKQKLGMD
jgi:transposase